MNEFSLTRPQADRTSAKRSSTRRCEHPFRLLCTVHGERIAIRCKRWRHCDGCRLWLQDRLRARLAALIVADHAPRHATFATLTFPASRAPNEDEAHRAWRSLVARLRYRGYLGPWGRVLQRTEAGVIHMHGILALPWFDDRLIEWRRLIQASGFGPQNRLEIARPAHANYCATYISSRLARLAPMRHAYSFSRDCPLPPRDVERQRIVEVGALSGMEPECDWVPAYLL